MDKFDEREKAFETKFARDEMAKFRVLAKRNRLLGEWAAQLLDLSGEQSEAYAKAVVAADLEEPGDDDVVGKVMADFAEAGLQTAEAEVREKLTEFLRTAQRDFASD